MVTTRYSDQQGSKIATKPLPGPTNREHRKRIGVKTMSLATNYNSVFTVVWSAAVIYQNLNYKLQRRLCLMYCPSNKIIKSDTKRFLALGGLHEANLCYTLQAMAPTDVKTVHRTSLLYVESNLDQLGLFKNNLNAAKPPELSNQKV